jgi:hypothetical protein
MTSTRPAPSLPSPQRPAAAAREVCRAAQAAAIAWAQLLEPDAHSRAVSQIFSATRDLGIAARGLADYKSNSPQPDPLALEYHRHTSAAARWLLDANERLDGVVAAEGIPPSSDPEDPGAALCRAARDSILAWRQPAGTAAERDEAVRHLITAAGFISAALLGLATSAPRRLAISLQVAGASVAESTAYLTAAIQLPEDGLG